MKAITIKAHAIVICTMAMVLATTVAYPQNLINGSFELGAEPKPLPDGAITLTAPDTTSLVGWTVSSGSVDYIGTRWVAEAGFDASTLLAFLRELLRRMLVREDKGVRRQRCQEPFPGRIGRVEGTHAAGNGS